jgi:glycerophosphoryl diester phosphodiesterase
VPSPLLRPPIAFGHRGARAHAPENTLEAFTLALRLGATGLESDVWLTADGVPVLDHDGVVRGGLRKRAIPDTRRADLPPYIPSLEEMYAECGTAFHLSLDVKHVPAAPRVVEVARAAGHDLSTLWLCHHDWEVVAGWRAALGDDVRLVDSTRLKRMKQGPERRAAQLKAAGIDCVNLHHTDWTGGLVALFHRFGRYAFGWDAQFDRVLDELVRMGIDGIFSDHVDRLVDAVGAVGPTGG